MKKHYVLFLLVLTTSVFAAVRPQMQSFNAGELSPLMRLRSDFSKYDSGCVTFQNMIPLSQGPAFRRPGLKYIATSPGPYPELICNYTSPTISTEPTDTALSGETDITTKTGLAAISGSGHYELKNDIDATGAWTPIRGFSGVLEGNGYTISNLTVSAAASDNQGMFGYIASNAEIRNLVLRDFTISGKGEVGALIGDANNCSNVVIKNVRVENSTLTAANDTVGGLLGGAVDVNDFQVIRCLGVNNTITTATGFAGGLIGYINHDAGDSISIKILNCEVISGTVTDNGYGNTGGLIGYIEGIADPCWVEIHTCNSNTSVVGAVDDGADFGGLLGYVKYADIIDSYSTGTVADDGSDRELYDVGGFIGFLGGYSDIINCYSTGDITLHGGGTGMQGGFIGKCDTDGAQIIHCYTTSDLNLYTVDTSAHLGLVGGFAGGVGSINASAYGVIQQCYSVGDIWLEFGVYAAARNGFGGFIGKGGTGGYGPDIDNCYTKSSIAVDDDKVGFFGGGFIGEFSSTSSDDWDVNDCYAQNVLPSGATVSGGLLGGFVGDDRNATYDVNCTNCYWDVETSGVKADDSNGASGLDTASMITESTFSTNWDYTSMWLTPDTEKRLLSFEYSEDDVYILEYGHKYMRVFRDGGQVLNSINGLPVQVRTPFEGSDLFDIQYTQLADTCYLVCPNQPPQVLTRSSHSDWTMEDMDIETGPFMDENLTTTTITPSSVEGVVVLTASEALWDAGDVGALWRLGHRRASTVITGILDANESSSIIEVYGDYNYSLQGTWEGTVTLEKSYDDGTNWVTQIPRYNKGSSIKEDYSNSEDETDVLFRVTMTDYVSGTATYNLVVYDRVQYGVVKITDFISTTVVKGEVFSTLGGTGATTKWAEGYWSDNNGWPRTIEFHEFRMFFGGTEAYPQTIWASRTDDYNDMTIGLLDTHALIYTLPSQNSMQWMLSSEYLFIGTLGGVGRLGDKDEGMAPTIQPVYREQSKFGGKYMQAILAGDSIIYVERTGRKVREIVYNLERDRFIAPDLTILAEHITGGGINDWAFQKRPDPTIWYIRDDGYFLSMTYNRLEHDIVGWGEHFTDGNALSVATIPSSNEDEVWFVIERTIDSKDVKYIEQMQPRDWGSDQEDCFYVDCGLTYDGTAATSFSGWDHLESETVSILADGLVVDNNSISGGAFGLSTAASVVHAGLPYTTVLETMPVVFTSDEGSTASQTKNVAQLDMSFYESLGTKQGIEGDTISVFFDTETTLQSELVKRSFQHGYIDDLTIYIEQVQPLPLTLRSLIPKLTVTER